MAKTSPQNLKVLVIGGGFGGVRAATRLSRESGFEVTLISNLTTFAFYPQFYHSATGGARSESALPLTDALDGTGVKFIQDVIVSIQPDAKTVTSADEKTSYHYDKLIMALGSVTNYFGIKGLKEFSYDIKSIQGAERFKRHLHDQLLAEHKPDLNYVVVGGGPTGVELAASLDAYIERITKLHGLEPRDDSVTLVEAAPRLLPRSAPAVSARVQRKLESLGVKVLTSTGVKAETAEALEVEGQSIATRTVVWTAGTSTNPFYYSNGAYFQLGKNGRVMVGPHLEAREDVYVIGDNADTPYAGMAQTAIGDADFVAKDIASVHRGRPRRTYKPWNPVSVIPVGERWAVAEWHGKYVYGLLGYLLRRAADLIAYADIERWPQAVRVWMMDSRREDNCPICSPAPNSKAEAKTT
jgi:NADH:ubiquinone reductase (H+-translocating)